MRQQSEFSPGGYPATNIGTRRFIALRSARVRKKGTRKKGPVLSHVARGDTREHENPRGLVREGTGTTVHDGLAGILHPARLGTVEPVPEGLDLQRMNPSRLFSRETHLLDYSPYSRLNVTTACASADLPSPTGPTFSAVLNFTEMRSSGRASVSASFSRMELR